MKSKKKSVQSHLEWKKNQISTFQPPMAYLVRPETNIFQVLFSGGRYFLSIPYALYF